MCEPRARRTSMRLCRSGLVGSTELGGNRVGFANEVAAGSVPITYEFTPPPLTPLGIDLKVCFVTAPSGVDEDTLTRLVTTAFVH